MHFLCNNPHTADYLRTRAIISMIPQLIAERAILSMNVASRAIISMISKPKLRCMLPKQASYAPEGNVSQI